VVTVGWATEYIEALKDGQTVQFRPRGSSMHPEVKSGELCTVEPIMDEIRKGDIVLCKVNGSQYLHFVKAVNRNRFLIGNNRGGINGWISSSNIFGKLK
tara:strand:- start:1537 stop:1833 length:297 start_codon:yes stop_codon:yes gene_type:complete